MYERNKIGQKYYKASKTLPRTQKHQLSTVSIMQPQALVALAIVLALTVPLSGAQEVTTGQSVAQLLKALIQDEESAKMLQEAMVQSVDASAQGFSLRFVGCYPVTSNVRSQLSNYLADVFPGKRITISCVAGMSHQLT